MLHVSLSIYLFLLIQVDCSIVQYINKFTT